MKYLAQQSVQQVFGEVKPPDELGGLRSSEGINMVIGNIITLIFTVAAVIFVIMFLWAAVSMISSGGDKESLAKARGRITWAIIGIVLLSLSFVVFRVLGFVTGFDILLFQ